MLWTWYKNMHKLLHRGPTNLINIIIFTHTHTEAIEPQCVTRKKQITQHRFLWVSLFISWLSASSIEGTARRRIKRCVRYLGYIVRLHDYECVRRRQHRRARRALINYHFPWWQTKHVAIAPRMRRRQQNEILNVRPLVLVVVVLVLPLGKVVVRVVVVVVLQVQPVVVQENVVLPHGNVGQGCERKKLKINWCTAVCAMWHSLLSSKAGIIGFKIIKKSKMLVIQWWNGWNQRLCFNWGMFEV